MLHVKSQREKQGGDGETEPQGSESRVAGARQGSRPALERGLLLRGGFPALATEGLGLGRRLKSTWLKSLWAGAEAQRGKSRHHPRVTPVRWERGQVCESPPYPETSKASEWFMICLHSAG